MADKQAKPSKIAQARLLNSVRVVVFLLCLTVILTSSIHLLLFLDFMGSSSLWHDELFSIFHYSSKGPLYVLTTYNEANNHIFFNLLNSLFHRDDLYDPLWARMLSFISIVLCVPVLIRYAFKHNALIEISIWFSLILSNGSLLYLCLEARGYGILILVTVISIISLLKSTDNNRGPDYVLIAALFIGSATVPVFALFAIILLVVKLAFTPGKKNMTNFLSLLLLLTLFYAPTYKQILSVASEYIDGQFTSIKAVWALIDLYALKIHKPSQIIPVLSISIVPALILQRKSLVFKPYSVILLSTFSFLTACLMMETPIIRSVSFVGVIISFLVTFGVIGTVKYFESKNRYYSLLYLFPLLYCLADARNSVEGFHYDAKEDHMHVAEFLNLVSNTCDSRKKNIVISFREQWLKSYYHKPDCIRLNDNRAIAEDVFYVHSNWLSEIKNPFKKPSIEYRVPQFRGVQQVFFIPKDNKILASSATLENNSVNLTPCLDSDLHNSCSIELGGNRELVVKLAQPVELKSFSVFSSNDICTNFNVVFTSAHNNQRADASLFNKSGRLSVYIAPPDPLKTISISLETSENPEQNCSIASLYAVANDMTAK